ncbi:MAG: hypothetical protein CVU56_11530 [Deltaproteobacteria bacterium HGW-Deltaproteobacteria-14]|nr:MAG: hypothetical protein CVU56_11530 [Deltaproteobacteria bacterium HGW-Deltaproteobacteria-14]
MDFITERIRALVLAFFDADAEGRALIPLASLGLGAFSTSLGPFDAEVRDLVLVVDLAALEVAFVPGSHPPRLRIAVDDAVVGLQQGTLAGTIDAFLFSGNVACGLANGANGRVAKLDLDLELELATTSEGGLDVRVLPSTVALQDVALSIRTDCGLSECLDGLSPPSTAECFECETICPVIDIGSALVSVVQALFSDLVDGLLDLLADDLANVFLDGFLNGRPLAVEGTLDLAGLFGAVLPWLQTARDLGVLARPAGDAFAISGSGDALGLDLVLDAGLDAAPTHPCVGALGPDPTYEPGLRPIFDGVARGPGGQPIPYDLALGVSGAVVNETLWALFKSGALCIDVTTDDLANATAGGLVVTARALALLLPGVTSLAGADAPVRIRVRPDLALAPAPVTFGDGVGAPLIGLALRDTRVDVDVLVGDQFFRVIGFRADLTVGLAVDVLPGAKLGLRVDDVGLDRFDLPDGELFADARLDLIAPFVVDLALGFLADRPITIEVGTSGLLDGFGVPIAPEVVALGRAGVGADWLAIYVAFAELPTPTTLALPVMSFGDARDGGVPFTAAIAPGDSVQLRVAGGSWSGWFAGPGPHRLEHPRLWLVGAWPVEARIRPAAGLPGQAFPVGLVHVVPALAPVLDVPSFPTAPPPPVEAPASPPPTAEGCTGGGANNPWALTLVLLALFARRRARSRTAAPARARAPARASVRTAAPAPARSRARLLALAAGLALTACADDAVAPARRCAHHDQCDDDYLCGPGGVCVAAPTCDHDLDCCPGAVCFSGWCRPTIECDDVAGRPCEGLGEACEAGRCVPAPCAADGACDGATHCFAGRCIAGLPCDDRCVGGELCDVASGRCLIAGSPPACGEGARAILAAGFSPEPLTCDGFAWPAECADLPTIAPGRPGVDGRLLELPSGPALVSYDPAYGDLVLSRFDASDARSDVALDGVPERAPEAPPRGYRGGVRQAGPDRGARPAVSQSGDGAALDVLYRDLDDGGLRHLRIDAATLTPTARGRVPVAGDAGRWSCLARRATPAGDRLAGLAFVARDPNGEVSALVRFEATADPPEGPEDWTVTPILTTPLPLTAAAPCGGSCGLAAVCVRRAGADDACGTTLGLDACPSPCGRHEACARVDGAAATCLPRVYPAYDAERLPFGRGPFATCARGADGELVGAWYDGEDGALVAGRWPFGAAQTAVVDVAADADLGRHARLAVAPTGRLFVAYRDETARALWIAEASAATGPWTRAVVDADPQGLLDLGGWPDLRFDAAGVPVVAYGEATHGDIRVARRGATGCWGIATALADGAFAWPGVLAVGDGELLVTALAFRFDASQRPVHAPVVTHLPLPTCGP